MIKKIIEPNKMIEETIYRIEFHPKKENIPMYSFLTDKDYNVIFDPEYYDIQKENYEKALNDKDAYSEPIKTKETRRYMQPTKVQCECNQHFELTNQYLGACKCPRCGRWYNLFGQELNPPETWEE